MQRAKNLLQSTKLPARTLLFILLAISALVACNNSDYNAGVQLALNHQFTQAYQKYLSAAHDGYAPAMLQVGNYLAYGRGVDKDMQKAETWYLRADRAGDKNAIPVLAKLYLKQGRYEQALTFLHKGLHRRDGESIYLLGRCYQEGWGVDKDKQKAIKYFLLAANLEYSLADFQLQRLGVNTWDTDSGVDLPVHSFFLLEHPSLWFILLFLNLLILPVYIKLFFADWQDFGEHLHQLFLRPGLEKRIEMASRGESISDGFERFKTVVWFVFYLSIVTAQYKLVTAIFY